MSRGVRIVFEVPEYIAGEIKDALLEAEPYMWYAVENQMLTLAITSLCNHEGAIIITLEDKE